MPVVSVYSKFGRVVLLVVACGIGGRESASVLQHGDGHVYTDIKVSHVSVVTHVIGDNPTDWLSAERQQLLFGARGTRWVGACIRLAFSASRK